MTLVEIINSDIIKAMKAKDNNTVNALRNIKTAFVAASTEKNAKTVEVNGIKQIDNDTAIKVLTKLSIQRKESAHIYTTNNRPELAELELSELNVIKTYLPSELSSEEIEVEVRKILSTIDAPNYNAKVGKTMGFLNKNFPGRINASLANDIIVHVIKELETNA